MPKYKRTRKTYRRSSKRRKTLKKTINAVVRKAIKPTQTIVRKAHFVTATNLISNYAYFNLSPIAGATNVFGTGANDLHRNQAKHIKLQCDFTVRAGTEDEGANITVYLVSLRNDCKDALYDTSSGLLAPIVNEDYQIANGAAFVNPRSFHIHRKWEILFPARSSAVDPRFNLYKRRSFTIRPNCLIKNERGDWSSLTLPQKPSHNYFLLAFNDNSGLDNEYPTLEFNCLNTYVC